MTLSAAAAAPTNLMLHLIKTTKDEPRMPDDTPEDIATDVACRDRGLPLPFPPFARPATKNSQAMAGSIHAPLVRIELCYFCPPSDGLYCLVLCLASCVFGLEYWVFGLCLLRVSQSPCGCCYVSGYHSYSCRRALHPIQISLCYILYAICWILTLIYSTDARDIH